MLLRLDNGVAVLIRPIAPEDKAMLAAGMAGLSEQSVYQRFLSPKAELSADELRYLTEVDFRDHVAYVAVLPGPPDVLVGVGRWIRLRDDPEALAERLADAARERGVRRFVATMLPDNLGAHRLFARVAQERETAVDGPVHELSGAIRPAA